MNHSKPKVLVILGPTASGKSDLAVELAKKFNGGIISADSRQVYKGLDLGSGKITKSEMKGIKHHLLDVASPKRTFTVEQYKNLAQKAIKDILKRGKLPIITGGTGLYIDAVIYNMQFPQVAPNKKLRSELEKLKTPQLFSKLKKLDPQRAKTIDPNNRRRLIRAIEIVETTGNPVPPQYLDIRYPEYYDVLKIGLDISREELEKRITKRLEKRLKQGMVKEVKNLRAKGISWKRLDDFGLEYRFISRYLRGLITKEEMKESIIKESLKYSKRQITWFKRDSNIIWENDKKKIERKLFQFLKKQPS